MRQPVRDYGGAPPECQRDGAESLAMQIDSVNHADDGGVDGRVGTADGGHGGKTFGSQQDALADASVYGVECEDGIAAVRSVEVKRLDNENLPA